MKNKKLIDGLLAILLRVGDLMDLEEGRICEFNMHLNSNYYNDSESMLHNSRHSDVKTYNYSSDRICIAVLTDDRQKYKIWMDWINYLDREVMYANTHYLTGETSDFFRNYKLPKVVKSVKPSDSAKFEVEEIRFRNDRAIQKIWKEVNQQKDIVDKKKKRYSEFLFQIHRREIEKIVDYKQLVLEIDNEFNTKKISTEIIKNEDAKGIIFIPTNFVDYDLGRLAI